MNSIVQLVAQMAIVLITAVRLVREVRSSEGGDERRDTEIRLLAVELLLAIVAAIT